MKRIARLGALLAALVLVASGCGSSGHVQAAQPPPIAQLRSIDQLRQAFNAHPRVPRLILLMSPT